MAHFVTFLTKVLLLYHWLKPFTSARRRDVVYFGTTLDPKFQKRYGKPATPCDEEFPFAFDTGHKCCKHVLKRNDEALHTDCDGLEINYYTSRLCCKRDNYIKCKKPPCKNRLICKLFFLQAISLDLTLLWNKGPGVKKDL